MHGRSLLKRHLSIKLRPLISGFYFALLGVRNLCMASRLTKTTTASSQEIVEGRSRYLFEKNKVFGDEANMVLNILEEI